MGYRELMLSIGALMVFAMVTISVNRNTLAQNDAIYGQQAEYVALNLAQQFIEEAKLRAYDEVTIDGTVSSPSEFNAVGNFGPGNGETYPNFDDVDDYHGLSQTFDTSIGPMQVDIEAYYVTDTDLTTDAAAKTYYKRMIVSVQSDYLNSPVRAEYVFSYQRN